MISEPKFNILLVDDRPQGIEVLRAAISDPQYNLIAASSGKEALAKLLDDEFVLILMDVQMPEMDGFETATLIKQRRKSQHIPIIFVTAIGESEISISNAYKVGAVDYIFKPFNPDILRSKVSVFIELHKQRLELRQKNERLKAMEAQNRLQLLERLEREGLRKYRNLADAVPHVIWRASDIGQVTYVNRTWSDYSGLTQDKSSGFGWMKAVNEADLKKLMIQWEEAAKKSTSFLINARIQSQASGKYRWFLVRGVPEFNTMEEVVSWILTATDIDDHMLVEQELQKAKIEADLASQAKSRFLANMSHEIRTPLGAILGFTELLANTTINEDERHHYLETIRRNGKLLSRIINEILDLSKIEAGKLELEYIRSDLQEIIYDIFILMSHSAADKGLGLDIEFANSLPKQVITDPTRLRQILVNIIGNAIKFTEKGSISLKVDCKMKNAILGEISISVEDNGPGLTKEQSASLFRPFSQADSSTTRKFGGTGLGLALSRNFAEGMGGRLELVRSVPGKGCTFELTIPIELQGDEECFNSLPDSVEVADQKDSSQQLVLAGRTILLADDSQDNQFLIGRFLKAAGAKVDFASNGREAYEKATSGSHDIVLMDIQMPEMDGLEATAKLRKSKYKKPIIALTAYALKEDRNKCLEVGCNEHLTKPVNRMQLISTLANYLGPATNELWVEGKVHPLEPRKKAHRPGVSSGI